MNTSDSDSRSDSTGISRRTVLKSTAFASGGLALGGLGLGTVPGLASADEHEGSIELCGAIDVMCAIDTSGSLNSDEVANLETGVNAFIDRVAASGADATIGSLEFGDNGVRNKNDLQAPSGLTVSVGSPGGNTPMPGALDVADQALYNDSAARSGALKLLLVFTDGGPNYTNTSYTLGPYTAPRDDSTNWSTTSGNDAYDEEGTAATGKDGRQVTVDEMDETALVASSIKDAAIGDGATRLITVYVGAEGEDQQAMGTDAMTKYTDLPTYLEEHVATPGFAFDVDVGELEGFVDELIVELQELCCPDCETGNALLEKYEFEEYEDGCDFVRETDRGDDPLIGYAPGSYDSKTGETCEPISVTFETDYCELDALVKAGRETYAFRDLVPVDGAVTIDLRELELEKLYAISNVQFYCVAPETPEHPGNGTGMGKGKGKGRGR